MKHFAVATILVAFTALVIYHMQPAQPQPEPFIYASFNAECTKQLEVECAVDIEKTIKACSTAFETGGSDVIADIKCAKDLMSDKKHCWPCICAEAKKKGWHIIGC